MLEKFADRLHVTPARVKEELHTWLFVSLGCALYCAATVFFLKPAMLPNTGVMGICLFLNYLLGIPLGISNTLFNLALFAFAYKVLPKRFLCWTLYAVLLISFLMEFYQIFPKPVIHDKMLLVIVAGLLHGMALAITFSVGGSTGGADIVSMAVRRKYGVELGNTSMYINFCVIFLFLSIVPVENAVYGFLQAYLTSLVLNGDLRAFNQRREAMIITSKPDEVRNFIIHELHRGVTIFTARGGWDLQERQVLIALLGHRQEVRLKLFLRKIDRKALLRLAVASEVHGNGFQAWEDSD